MRRISCLLALTGKRERGLLSFEEFLARFPNDAACADFLFKKCWPDGFL